MRQEAALIQVLVLSLSLLVQLTAAAFALRLMFVTGRRFAWGALALAILLMGARRAISLADLAGSPHPSEAVSAPEIVALAISLLVLISVLSIKPVFDAAQECNRVERRFGRVLDSSLHEIFIFRAADLRFIRVNRGARDNLGYCMEELSSLTPLDLKPEFSEETFREKLLPLESGEVERIRFSTRHLRKDGTQYPVEVDLQLTQEMDDPSFIAVIHDVTERVRAENAVAQSEAHFRSLIENAQDVITVLDEKGTIVYHSPSIEKVLGYRPEERIGHNAMDTVHPDDLDRTLRTLRAVLEDSGPRSVTYRLQHQDGSWRTVEATGSVRCNPDGTREVVVNQRDITDRERIEAQLRQSQRLETIGTLAGGIAHDFNNFLTPILGYTDLLKRAAGSDVPVGLEEIGLAGERAKQLVRQILTFSRQTDSERCPVDFGAVVHEAVALVRATLPANVELRFDIDPETGCVLADRTQLHQVVMNICTNAYQAMAPDGGALIVEAHREDGAAGTDRDASQLEPGAYVGLTIRDSGPGMTDGTLERLFEPFFTTKGATEGTGLGLSVAHGIVTGHGGDIKCLSAPGKGTIFRIRLPRIQDVEMQHVEEPAPSRGSERILVVDDDVVICRYLESALGSFGYDVTCVNRPEDAFHLLGGATCDFDLLITDFTMPGMSGVQLATAARETRRDLPIVMMSGSCEQKRSMDAPDGVINATLAKPFHLEELGRVVREALVREDIQAPT